MAIAIIPARQGSKRFPGKNRLLFDKTFSMALELLSDGYVDDIVITSDDPAILRAINYAGVTGIWRNAALSGDDVDMVDVIKDVLSKTIKQRRNAQKVLLLQPTSPARRIEIVKHVISALTEDVSCVLTVDYNRKRCFDNNAKLTEVGARENGECYCFWSDKVLDMTKPVLVYSDGAVDIDTIGDYVDYLIANGGNR